MIIKKSIFFLLLSVSVVQAQVIDAQDVEVRLTLPEVSLVSIKPDNSTIVFSMETSDLAGEKAVFASTYATQLWLNYTCSIAPNSPTKNLSAQIISGSVPEGLELLLKVSEYSGSGSGQFGVPLPLVKLRSYPQTIMTNIGGSYTNKGVNQGHQLEYELEITNYKRLDAKNSNILTIIYTLSDN